MTDHFTLKEFIFSAKAQERRINNNPTTDVVLESLLFTALGLERIRAALGELPIKVNSGYRSPELNIAVGGSIDSQHMKGEAVDFTCPAYGNPREIVWQLQDQMRIIGIDQMILEGTWVHCSFTYSPRYELLTYQSGKYFKGIV